MFSEWSSPTLSTKRRNMAFPASAWLMTGGGHKADVTFIRMLATRAGGQAGVSWRHLVGACVRPAQPGPSRRVLFGRPRRAWAAYGGRHWQSELGDFLE
jgi:hypothetical protein